MLAHNNTLLLHVGMELCILLDSCDVSDILGPVLHLCCSEVTLSATGSWTKARNAVQMRYCKGTYILDMLQDKHSSGRCIIGVVTFWKCCMCG